MRRNKFELLYDFSLEAGDTMSIVTPGLIDVKYGKDTLIHYYIESTGTIELNGDVLRTQKLKLFRPEGNNSSYFIGDYIIEKIGNNHFFLPYHSLGCDAYCPIPLRCYQDDSLFYKAVEYACDTTYVISATGPVPGENEIKIYPNPAQAGSEIFIDGIEVTQWYLWDIQGKLISKGSTEVGTKTIDIPPSLRAGMYIIEFRSGKELYFRKVIFN